MKVKCKINKSVYDNHEIQNVSVYGLTFYYINMKNKYIKIVNDIFADKQKVEFLCELINSNDLDEIHIDDIIEDFLCE